MSILSYCTQITSSFREANYAGMHFHRLPDAGELLPPLLLEDSCGWPSPARPDSPCPEPRGEPPPEAATRPTVPAGAGPGEPERGAEPTPMEGAPRLPLPCRTMPMADDGALPACPWPAGDVGRAIPMACEAPGVSGFSEAIPEGDVGDSGESAGEPEAAAAIFAAVASAGGTPEAEPRMDGDWPDELL